jgi:hypothetical protein
VNIQGLFSAMDENPSAVSITAVVVEVPKKGGKRKVHKGTLNSIPFSQELIFSPFFRGLHELVEVTST